MDKYYPDRHQCFSIDFECEKCQNIIETMNGRWKDDVPEKCEKCGDGKYIVILGAPRIIDTNKLKNWNENTPIQEQVRILSSNDNPY